jgi:DNA-binding NarL/FixJ family response regulator
MKKCCILGVMGGLPFFIRIRRNALQQIVLNFSALITGPGGPPAGPGAGNDLPVFCSNPRQVPCHRERIVEEGFAGPGRMRRPLSCKEEGMGKPYRIVIAEDHTILREGLRAILSSDPEFEIAGEARDGREAMRCVETSRPDLVLMDLSMPRTNGLEAIKEIKKQNPEIRVVALTVHKTEEYILEALKGGADGYVLKDATQSELVAAIKNVLMGKRYLSPDISEKIIEGYLEGKKTVSAWESLTQREREILKLIAEGYKNKEVADYLCISLKTVEKHRANLMKKLDLHNAAALTAFAMEKGLVNR